MQKIYFIPQQLDQTQVPGFYRIPNLNRTLREGTALAGLNVESAELVCLRNPRQQ